MDFAISLKNLCFKSFHGVLPHEREYGNEFIVNLTVKVPVKNSLEDDIDNTVSYVSLFEIVSSEMEIASNLLETVLLRIVSSIKAKFPFISGGVISIEKRYPPIRKMVGSAEVSLSF